MGLFYKFVYKWPELNSSSWLQSKSIWLGFKWVWIAFPAVGTFCGLSITKEVHFCRCFCREVPTKSRKWSRYASGTTRLPTWLWWRWALRRRRFCSPLSRLSVTASIPERWARLPSSARPLSTCWLFRPSVSSPYRTTRRAKSKVCDRNDSLSDSLRLTFSGSCRIFRWISWPYLASCFVPSTNGSQDFVLELFVVVF